MRVFIGVSSKLLSSLSLVLPFLLFFLSFLFTKMAEMSEEPKFTLRLIIDEEKKKVVLAEACRDFVDVLFSLMTLPMGTIVGLLKKHQKSEIGCFGNIYKSVADMSTDSFMTGACKQMLLNPRSVTEAECKRLKLNLNPTTDHHLKYFKCSYFSSCNMCSDFSGSDCACGRLMNHEIELSEVEDQIQNDAVGVFVSGRSSFIITDDLKVSLDSTGLVLNTLNSLGCSDVSKLGEQLLDIGLSEVPSFSFNYYYCIVCGTNMFLTYLDVVAIYIYI